MLGLGLRTGLVAKGGGKSVARVALIFRVGGAVGGAYGGCRSVVNCLHPEDTLNTQLKLL